MNKTTPRRKLAAILAADIVGFSRMMGENEDRTLHNLKACRAITDESIETYHGRVFGSAGDSVIAEFASPVDAIVAAVEFQRNMRDRNNEVAPEDQMQFRVGLNLGDVIVEGDNLYGDGVNVAARLEPLAEPGGICVSGKFHDEVRRKLDLGFVSSGPQEMKNIEEPVHTFMVEIGSSSKVLEAFTVPTPAEPTSPAASSACRLRCQGSSNCGATFYKHGRRSGTGVLRRRYHRGHHHEPLALAYLPSYLPQLKLHLPGTVAQPQAGSTGTRRTLHCGGQCTQER